jgi:hypothetical protein
MAKKSAVAGEPEKTETEKPSHPDQQPGESGIPVNQPPPDEQEGGEPKPASEKHDEKAKTETEAETQTEGEEDATAA